MRRPIKIHLVNRSNWPVYRSNRPVYRSKPITYAILNLDSVKPAGKPVKPARTGWTAPFEFKFEFNRFLPVTGQTGPVNRNRRLAVTGNRSDNKTLSGGERWIYTYYEAVFIL